MDIFDVIANEREIRTKVEVIDRMVDSGLHTFEESLKIVKLSKEEYDKYNNSTK